MFFNHINFDILCEFEIKSSFWLNYLNLILFLREFDGKINIIVSLIKLYILRGYKLMNQELELVESMDKLNILMHKFQTELLNGDLKEYTLRQLYYIELIDKHEGISVSEISKTLELKKSTISIAINQLIELEIVTKIQSNTDKRFYFLNLTSKGKDIMKMHKQVHQNTIKKIIDILNPQEVESFIKIVDKITVLNL